MTDCTTCAQALRIAACPTHIAVGLISEDAPPVTVWFTDRATGRLTVAETDDAQLPMVVAITPFDFAPGGSVMVEVVAVTDEGPGAPIEFFPTEFVDGLPQSSMYPVTCINFTPVKAFDAAGWLVEPGPRTLIVAT